MSDIFDHYQDAMEDSMYGGRSYEEGYSGGSRDNFFRDPLYYYNQRSDITIQYETQKAYLLKDSVGKFWCPKGMAKEVNNIIYIQRSFRIEYLEENN